MHVHPSRNHTYHAGRRVTCYDCPAQRASDTTPRLSSIHPVVAGLGLFPPLLGGGVGKAASPHVCTRGGKVRLDNPLTPSIAFPMSKYNSRPCPHLAMFVYYITRAQGPDVPTLTILLLFTTALWSTHCSPKPTHGTTQRPLSPVSTDSITAYKQSGGATRCSS